MGQQGAVWTRTAKDRESWRTGGGLLPAEEGQSLEYCLHWFMVSANKIELK